RVRRTIRKAVPHAAEMISYQIPAYKLNGAPVLYFAAWKEHYSLYPATKGVVTKFKRELAACELKKATIRFPLFQPIPVNLIPRRRQHGGIHVNVQLRRRRRRRCRKDGRLLRSRAS